MPAQTIILKSNPGIKRDGTKFDGDFYTDGQWVRFQRGLPRKMGGYKSLSIPLGEMSRGLTNYPQNNLVFCHSGGETTLERFTLDDDKLSSPTIDRTPTTLTASAYNHWMFDHAFDASVGATQIIAQVAPNGSNFNNAVGGQIFSGDVDDTVALTEITLPPDTNATGGVVMLHPYLFYYGSGGIVGWSVAGDITDLTGSGSGIARPWGQKIIKGLPLRAGAGSAPAGIFWAYDAIIRASFVGGSAVFQFDTLATDTSILSADCVVDYDGVFYWAGIDRFLMFNGVVREVPNAMNLNWFFDHLNLKQRTQVFAFKVPRYGEIWWCYPRDNAAECSHAIIYNVRENTWYDTELPSGFRTAASFCNAYAIPLMVGGDSKVWLHEQGVDRIESASILTVESHFETCDISSIATKGMNAKLRLTAIEPDFVQAGPLEVQVTGRANARSPEVISKTFVVPETATETYEQIVMLKEQRRELRVKFTSNSIGGDYQMGQIIAHLESGDHTVLG